MFRGLTLRILIAAVFLGVFFVIQLLITNSRLDAIRQHTRSEQRAEQSIVAAIGIERLLIDVSSATRGYVLSRDPSFLESWRSARSQLPAQSRELLGYSTAPGAHAVVAGWHDFLSSYSAPLIAQATTDPQRAKARVGTLEGLMRLTRVRTTIDRFVAQQNTAVARDRAEVDRTEHRTLLIEDFGGGIRVGVFLLVFTYLLRSIVWPLRRIAAGTREVAAGDWSTRVPERGAGEVGELAVSFNEMAASLERGRAALEEQNSDLERLANVLRAVLDSTIDGIVLTDADGTVQLTNRTMVELVQDLGMSFEGPVVDRLLSVAPRMKEEERYRAAMERLRSNPDEPTFDEFEDASTGRVYQGFTSTVRDDHGGFVGRIWTLRDVTQQRELDRLKDEFVATVSHELRTPLTSMMGFLEMVREGEAGALTDEQKRFLAIVYRSSERLQRLVGDLLFVSRLDANGLQMQFADVSIDEVVRECIESSSALARSRDIELAVDLDGVPPVWADKERLAQLVMNLVSNAIKFTPDGGRVDTRTAVEGGRAVIEVRDTGIGIPEAEIPRLFQRFFRSSTATEQAIPGTGLGLVISKAIAEAHGGRITLTSEAGKGSCFRVELPLGGDDE
ncbi:MAG TPA: ATP-binding protein [Gaiellaceae bacterium]|nr:ATP-binding protein [Gaiellaceae bacterium]